MRAFTGVFVALALCGCPPNGSTPDGGSDAGGPAPFGPGRYAMVTVALEDGVYVTRSGDFFEQPTQLPEPVAGDRWAVTRKGGQVVDVFPVAFPGSMLGEGLGDAGEPLAVEVPVEPVATFRVPLMGNPDKVELIDVDGNVLWSEPIGSGSGPLKQGLLETEGWAPISEHPALWLLNPGGISLLPRDVMNNPCGAFDIVDTRVNAGGVLALLPSERERLIAGLRTLSPAVLDSLFIVLVAHWRQPCSIEALVAQNKLIINDGMLTDQAQSVRFDRILIHESAHALEFNLNPSENQGLPVAAQAMAARRAAEQGAFKGGFTPAYRALHESAVDAVVLRRWIERTVCCTADDTECQLAMNMSPFQSNESGFARPYGVCNPSEDLATITETAKKLPGIAPIDGSILCTTLASSPLSTDGVANKKQMIFYAKLRMLLAGGFITQDDFSNCVGNFKSSDDATGQTMHRRQGGPTVNLNIDKYGPMAGGTAFGFAANNGSNLKSILHLPAPNGRYPWGVYNITYQGPAAEPYDYATPGFLYADSNDALGDRAASGGRVFVLDVTPQRTEVLMFDLDFVGADLTIFDDYSRIVYRKD